MSRFSWPSRPALRLAVVLVALLAVIATGAWLVGGAVATLGVVFGAVTGLAVAVADVGWTWRVALAAVTGLAGLAGVWAADRPVLAGAVVALAAVAQVPFTERGARFAMMLPVVPALTASVATEGSGPALAGWLSAGVLVIGILAVAMRVSLPAQGTPRAEAVRHALATAVVAGAGLGVARALDVGHGYWLVLAVASVLAVSRDATGREAAERVAGTLSGVLLAVLLVAVLPVGAALALAAVGLVLTLAWSVGHEVRLAAASGSAVAVLLGSGGLVDFGAGLAVERLVLTVVGAGLAAATVALLWRLDRGTRVPRDPEPVS